MAYSTEASGNKGMAFILGAVVVAVLVLGFFILGGQVPTGAPASGEGGGNTSITIENPSAPAPQGDTGAAAPAPAAGSAPSN